MSTTTLSASSCARRKVASTTYVAPCRRCAGPKTSPRKLCAIIMWSRTVTLYTGSRSGIPNDVAQRGKRAGGQLGEDVGQLVEPGLSREDGVESLVPQQVQSERQ